jgi:hypothetical protein
MKYIKLFESFSDFPNTEEDINRICIKYLIENYTINEDMSIDVDDDVELCNERFTKFPLKFNRVFGDFNCSCNQLTTLEGGPKEVGGYFYCHMNQLKSLEGSPKEVGGNFYCFGNQLTTLEGSPYTVGGDFNCSNNLLITLEGAPKIIGGTFYCYPNPVDCLFKLFNEDYKWLNKSIKEYSWLDGTEIDKMRLIDVFIDLDLPEPDLSKIYKIYTLF